MMLEKEFRELELARWDTFEDVWQAACDAMCERLKEEKKLITIGHCCDARLFIDDFIDSLREKKDIDTPPQG